MIAVLRIGAKPPVSSRKMKVYCGVSVFLSHQHAAHVIHAPLSERGLFDYAAIIEWHKELWSSIAIERQNGARCLRLILATGAYYLTDSGDEPAIPASSEAFGGFRKNLRSSPREARLLSCSMKKKLKLINS